VRTACRRKTESAACFRGNLRASRGWNGSPTKWRGHTCGVRLRSVNIRMSTSLALGPPLRMKIWAARRSKWSGHTCAVRLRPYNIRFAKTVRTEPLGRDGLGKTLNHRQNDTGDPGAPSIIFEARTVGRSPLAGAVRRVFSCQFSARAADGCFRQAALGIGLAGCWAFLQNEASVLQDEPTGGGMRLRLNLATSVSARCCSVRAAEAISALIPSRTFL